MPKLSAGQPGASCGVVVTKTVPAKNVGQTQANTFTAVGPDDEGTAASASASAAVTYADVVPSATLISAVINENGVASVTLTVADPATTDTCTVTLDWGEGLPQALAVPCNAATMFTY